MTSTDMAENKMYTAVQGDHSPNIEETKLTNI